MSAPIGNKFAQGNKGGRPLKIAREDLVQLGNEMVADFQVHLDTLEEHKNPIFIENWARRHNISDVTLRRYCEENEEFCASYKRCKQIQKEVLIKGGLKGWFNPTAFIFTAKNITDMRDKIETDITSGGQPITGMQIVKE